MTELTAKTCTPCQGGIPPMNAEAARGRLAEVPGWSLDDGATRLQRTWKTADFASAYRIVQAAAEIAEAEGHHPDVCFGWGYCTVVVYTHKIKGLHENDFVVAAKLNAAVD